jgi:Fur family ferric uptake transcriptional regulator
MSIPPKRTESLDAKAMIRSAGLRATHARIAVIEQLAASEGPKTHGDLVAANAAGCSDASTWFRALNDLAEVGIVRRMELGDHVWRYELSVNSETTNSPHPHFLCVDCGQITCLTPIDLSPQLKANRTLRRIGEVTEVLLKGHCAECR